MNLLLVLALLGTPTDDRTGGGLSFSGGTVGTGIEITAEGVCTAPNSMVFDVNGQASCAPGSDLAPGDSFVHGAHSFPEGTQDPSVAYVAGGLGPKLITFDDFANSTGDASVLTILNCVSGVCSSAVTTITESSEWDCDLTSDAACAIAYHAYVAANLPTGIVGVVLDGVDVYFTPDLGTLSVVLSVTDAGGGAGFSVTNGTDGNVEIPVGRLLLGAGTQALPPLAFAAAPNWGLWYNAALGNLDIVTNGSTRMRFTTVFADLFMPLDMNSAHVFSSSGPLELGANFATSHGFGTGDVGVANDLEVDGELYADNNVNMQDNRLLQFGGATDFKLEWDTAQTNHAFVMGTGDSKTILVLAGGQMSTNYAHAAAAHPQLVGHSSTAAASATDEWWSITHDVNNVVITAGKGNINLEAAAISLAPQMKDLTAGAATVFAKVALPTDTHFGAQIDYSIHADDGTDYQVRSGSLTIAAVNKAGTITCDIGTPPGNFEAVALSSSTLTHAMSCADAGGGVLDLTDNAVSGLTETTLELHYSIHLNDPAVVTPQ